MIGKSTIYICKWHLYDGISTINQFANTACRCEIYLHLHVFWQLSVKEVTIHLCYKYFSKKSTPLGVWFSGFAHMIYDPADDYKSKIYLPCQNSHLDRDPTALCPSLSLSDTAEKLWTIAVKIPIAVTLVRVGGALGTLNVIRLQPYNVLHYLHWDVRPIHQPYSYYFNILKCYFGDSNTTK